MAKADGGYTDPYEEWKAQGRPGGSFDQWKNPVAGGGKGENTQALDPSQAGSREQWGETEWQNAGARRSGQAGTWAGGYDPSNNAADYRAWYNSMQGGNRSEDMDRFGIGDFQRWDPYLIKEGKDAGKYRSSRGAEGVYDKPTECPPGWGPGGGKETDPCVPYSPEAKAAAGEGGGGGGGGQGGGGGKGGGQAGGAWDNPIFQYLRSSGLEAAQDPEKALSTFMGYGGAGQYQQEIDQARMQAEQLPPGPARDAAMARLQDMKVSGLSQMRQAASQMARGDLQTTMNPELSYSQLGENARQANMQNKLGWGGLDVQKMLGMGNLDLANRQFGWESGSKWADILAGQGADRDLQEKLANMQIKAGQPSGLQKGLGIGGTLAGIAGTAATLL